MIVGASIAGRPPRSCWAGPVYGWLWSSGTAARRVQDTVHPSCDGLRHPDPSAARHRHHDRGGRRCPQRAQPVHAVGLGRLTSRRASRLQHPPRDPRPDAATDRGRDCRCRPATRPEDRRLAADRPASESRRPRSQHEHLRACRRRGGGVHSSVAAMAGGATRVVPNTPLMSRRVHRGAAPRHGTTRLWMSRRRRLLRDTQRRHITVLTTMPTEAELRRSARIPRPPSWRRCASSRRASLRSGQPGIEVIGARLPLIAEPRCPPTPSPDRRRGDHVRPVAGRRARWAFRSANGSPTRSRPRCSTPCGRSGAPQITSADERLCKDTKRPSSRRQADPATAIDRLIVQRRSMTPRQRHTSSPMSTAASHPPAPRSPPWPGPRGSTPAAAQHADGRSAAPGVIGAVGRRRLSGGGRNVERTGTGRSVRVHYWLVVRDQPSPVPRGPVSRRRHGPDGDHRATRSTPAARSSSTASDRPARSSPTTRMRRSARARHVRDAVTAPRGRYWNQPSPKSSTRSRTVRPAPPTRTGGVDRSAGLGPGQRCGRSSPVLAVVAGLILGPRSASWPRPAPA